MIQASQPFVDEPNFCFSQVLLNAGLLHEDDLFRHTWLIGSILILGEVVVAVDCRLRNTHCFPVVLMLAVNLAGMRPGFPIL